MNPENFKTLCGLLEDAGAAVFMFAVIYLIWKRVTRP